MRTCPFDNCGIHIRDDFFACAAHWRQLSRPLQDEIWESYNAYMAGELPLADLRRRQEAVLAEWRAA